MACRAVSPDLNTVENLEQALSSISTNDINEREIVLIEIWNAS